jgi:hypothetical protein
MGEMGNSNGISVWEPEEDVQLRRKSRWENGVKMYLKELGCDNIDWINLVYDGDQWLIDVCVV